MKAITLWQPWATLVAIGAKTIETRSWGTSYRGPLAIHAGVATSQLYLAAEFPFVDYLRQYGYTSLQFPLGCVVATCTLQDVRRILHHWTLCVPAEQRPLGNFTLGRYAWYLTNIKPVDPPVPARGRQGFWDWERVENDPDQY